MRRMAWFYIKAIALFNALLALHAAVVVFTPVKSFWFSPLSVLLFYCFVVLGMWIERRLCEIKLAEKLEEAGYDSREWL